MLEASRPALGTRISGGDEPDAAVTAPALALRYGAYALVVALLAAAAMPLNALLAVPLSWLALANALVAYGYQTGRVAVFGKRDDGRIGTASMLALLPYLSLVWGFLRLKIRFLRRNEPCWHEAAPRLYVGRRPSAFELPPDCTRVIDLTCEFVADPELVRRQAYQCLPTLNRHVPREAELRALLQPLVAYPGSLYVHCGAGRGRSAMVVAALLVLRGHAPDVDAAERSLARLRPGVKLHAAQRALIARCCASLGCGAGQPDRPASASTP